MKKILVIEDEAIMQTILRDTLEMEGFQITLANNGHAGITAAKQDTPDLILCDVIMPGAGGHEVIEVLRRDPATAHIPFIFLTAKGERHDVRTGMNLGADDYLVKPFDINELLEAITARLERARQQKGGHTVDFSTPEPLEKLGLSQREAEVLLWVVQGKTNSEVSVILNISISTVKKHLESTFVKLGVESRTAASMRAMEALSRNPQQAT